MIYMRWTGLGCLMPVLVIAILIAGIYIGWVLIGGDSIPALILVGAGVTVLLAPLHWLFGLALNFEWTPARRGWDDEHTYFDMPVQYGFIPQLVFALILGSIALGQLTSALYGWLLFGGGLVVALVGYGLFDKERRAGPVGGWAVVYALVALIVGSIVLGQTAGTLYGWLLVGGVLVVALVGYGLFDKERHLGPVSGWAILYALVALIVGSIVLGQLTSALYGWLLFVGVPVVALVGYVRIYWRRRLRSVADRKELAVGRGWLYKDRGSDLGRRWQDLFGKKVADGMSPFGVLAGELEGLPFTAFDSEPGGSETRRTYWAIHLPVAYPRVQAHAARQNSPDDLRAETADAAFGQALLTPQVRSATAALGLVGWRIEGRDLILERQCVKPHTAKEVVQVAAHLAWLACQLPADLADRFGTPPSTDIPLRGKAGAA